ncbi:MAG: hypothetical protein HYS70_01055, partial [Nitrospinae bacterium]|nr:hypothetical protein [Nitrospinota bacterium]
MNTTKGIVESVLGIPTTKKLWTVNYPPALPFTPEHFTMGGVLPAVLYMFRWGHRRGKGAFAKTFGKELEDKKMSPPTIEDVLSELAKRNDWFEGFESTTGKTILGDMLLTFCLENKNHQTGRVEQIQRAFATHYLASWIDLPDSVANLRYIPEMLVALLVHQKEGELIQQNSKPSIFSVGSGFEENVLLKLFGNSMQIKGPFKTDLTSDYFHETNDPAHSVGLDQLLTVRIAQACGQAPTKAKGGGESEKIENQYPLAQKAAKDFREDLNVFIQAYGETIPRQAFLQMMESCIALGLTNIYFSTIKLLLEWEQTGVLTEQREQNPWPIFVDCSCGNEHKLRNSAEESMADFLRRFERVPVVMMCLRILDDKVRFIKKLKDSLPKTCPDATEFINLLGSIFHGPHSYSEKILDDLDELCSRLADELEKAEEALEVQELLTGNGNPVARLAEAICLLMGDTIQKAHYLKAIHSCLMIDRPNGLAKRRKVQRRDASGKRTSADARSMVLTNTLLDFLVHRHLRKAAKGKGAAPL